MVSNNKIYADTSKTFCNDQENYTFTGYQLPESEYNKVKEIVSAFPAELAKRRK